MRVRAIACVLLLTWLTADAVYAQGVTAGIGAYGAFGVDDMGGELPIGAELRASVQVSPRIDIEPFVIGFLNRRASHGVPAGLVGLRVRQRLDRFTTGGGYAYISYAAFAPLVFGEVGVGLHGRVSRRIAVRAELNLVNFVYILPIGVRAFVGVVVAP